MADREFRYGGFWSRFGALLLDTIIPGVPLMLAVVWAEGLTRYFWLLFLPVSVAIEVFYSIYLVRRFGGTPGKLLMGLRVLKLNGSAVGYREAILRALPDIIFLLVADLGSAFAALSMTNDAYFSRGWLDLQAALNDAAPRWCRWSETANTIWTWSELIVLLTNRKRRALHDFLAGTVVIVVPEEAVPTSPSIAET